MDDSSRIDYQRAAERLLVALSFIARKLPGKPVPAVTLCSHIFDTATRKHWSRETRRRRVRDAVDAARRLLHDRYVMGVNEKLCEPPIQLIGNGQGYLVTGDAQAIFWYAGQRRRRGLAQLAAGSQVKRDLTGASQQNLFEVNRGQS